MNTEGDFVGVSPRQVVDPQKAALADLVKWSEDAAAWQRDALRRIYLQGNLGNEDVDELYEFCRRSNGLSDADDPSPNTEPLSDAHAPSNVSFDEPITLARLASVQNVNALVVDQKLAFLQSGLTIVYGDNGAGKSGYCRILKRAWRARHKDEEILPNAYSDTPTGPASAKVTYAIGNQHQPEVIWSDGVPAHPDLSHISVFDSQCAVIHVDGVNELAYIPFPLQVLQLLAQSSVEMATRLRREKKIVEAQLPEFRKRPNSHEGTKVYQELERLSALSKMQTFKDLADLTDKEKERFELLKRVLSGNPAKRLQKVKALKARLESLRDTCTAATTNFGTASLNEFRELLIVAKQRAKATELAARLAFGNEPLPQAGSEIWKQLWNAAREFSQKEIYPSSRFPNVDQSSVCVLCQQTLDADATNRMLAFEQFVTEKTQQSALEAKRIAEKRRKEFDAAIPQRRAVQDAVYLLRDELARAKTCSQVVRLLAKTRVRGRLLARLEDAESIVTSGKLIDPLPDLRDLLGKADEKIVELRRAADAEERKAQQRELWELEDRYWVSNIVDDLEQEIERLKKLNRYDDAIHEADTNRITRKATELSKILVTDPMRDGFASEVAELGISDRRIELNQESSAYGAAKFRISLIRRPDASVGKILSEGEHRCVALAAFFAELATAHNRSGIILDDPVSSLDHEFRDAVAKRIAREAASASASARQVIVFTHDVVFLERLSHYARESSGTIKFLTVSRVPDSSQAGVIDDGIPSTVAPAADLAEGLEKQVLHFEGAYKSGKRLVWEVRTESFSNQLRKCWERAVAEALEPVVRRFDSRVDTKNVWQIAALEEADFVEMRSAYKRCSELSHEKHAELGRTTPAPANYLSETVLIKEWIKRVWLKQENAQRNRPSV